MKCTNIREIQVIWSSLHPAVDIIVGYNEEEEKVVSVCIIYYPFTCIGNGGLMTREKRMLGKDFILPGTISSC